MEEQRSPQWYAARLGKLTGSTCKELFGTPLKRKQLLLDIVAERLTQQPRENFISNAMLHGIETEDIARECYEVKYNLFVKQTGFVEHPTITNLGASPDGLIGDDGVLEIKCPTSRKHLQYIIEGKVPDEYVPQMLCELCCTGRKWCDFVSFDNRVLDDRYKMFVIRFEPDEEQRTMFERRCIEFLNDVERSTNNLSELSKGK